MNTLFSVLRKRMLLVLSVLGLTCLLLSSIGGAAQASPALAGSMPLRINMGEAPQTLDPQKASQFNEIAQLDLIYEGLTRIDSHLNTVPAAATSWTYSDSNLTITLTLRSGLTYSDGSLLNARRFEYAILRSLDPRNQSGYFGYTMVEIEGAEAYYTADPNTPPAELAKLRARVAVHALDTSGKSCTAYTQTNCTRLRMKLTNPNMAFLQALALSAVYPAKEELITKGGANWWKTPANLIGNGPFVAKKLDFTNGSILQPNTHYWRGKPGYTLWLYYMPDPAEAISAYQKKQLDMTPVTAAEMQDPLLKPEIRQYAGNCTYAVYFNMAVPPFTDPKIRQAFAYAINRQAYVQNVQDNFGLPSLTWVPQGVPGYQSGETRWGYNVTLAKNALAASSYGSAAKLPAITVKFKDTPRQNQRWGWLAAQWKSVLGVTVKLSPQPASQDFTSPLYFWGWCPDFPDLMNYLSYWHSTNDYAVKLHYANSSVDALLEQADSSPNPATRLSLYKQAQNKVIADAPAIFLYTGVNAYLVRPSVKGAVSTNFDRCWMGERDPLTLSTLQLPFSVYLPSSRR